MSSSFRSFCGIKVVLSTDLTEGLMDQADPPGPPGVPGTCFEKHELKDKFSNF